METLSLHIPPDHAAYAGHFPGMPITPGVVLMDEVIHAITRHAQLNAPPCKVNSIKFLKPVLPDAQLTVHYEIRANGNIYFDVKENQLMMVTGVFSA